MTGIIKNMNKRFGYLDIGSLDSYMFKFKNFLLTLNLKNIPSPGGRG
jgi:hypothetical protein